MVDCWIRIVFDNGRDNAHFVRVKAREIIKAIEAEGWTQARVTGSHCHFRHPSRPGLVTVPIHGSADVKLAVLRSIEKQSGVSLRKGR